ncbi:hypothetical protein E2C01_057218 [Portunus trituberculatus]|uniref:Uncharacterized protein n=1 Tax=Portunus trituberculatus TaxID=210409 RepID=A0A5B7H2R7_PORTR|nr:hypothetical protein [Portunus trituberculatus]
MIDRTHTLYLPPISSLQWGGLQGQGVWTQRVAIWRHSKKNVNWWARLRAFFNPSDFLPLSLT